MFCFAVLLGEASFWYGVTILSFCFSAMKDAKTTTQQGRQRAEEASADAPSFSFRTCEISAKEGLVLSSAKSSPLDFLELNCGCNKKAVTTRNGQAKASPVMGEPLQKYQSLDFSSILFGSCPSAPPIINTAGGCPDSRRPVIRTKSTPFELIHQRQANELDTEDGSSCLASQLHEPCLVGLQAPSVTHVSSEELNYSLPRASEHPTYDASAVPQHGPGVLRVHSCMSLVEDPYFPSSPPNSADSKMSFDLPEKQDGATFPCALLPTSPTTPFSYCNAQDSLMASPLTSFPPPLNQETAIEGKSFFFFFTFV